MSLKKLAIFVEGQTESIFVKKLLLEIAGRNNITFKQITANQIIQLTTNDSGVDKKYFILIVDCGGDESVKSRILENRTRLIRENYTLVIGLRDVYPLHAEDIPRLEQGMKTGVPTNNLKIEFCLAKMETEAWFLQEYTHYKKIDPRLTNELIIQETNFDPKTDNTEQIYHPAELLKEIYRIVGRSYKKTSNQVNRTVNSLDYEEVYIQLPEKLQYFKQFITHIDNFMT